MSWFTLESLTTTVGRAAVDGTISKVLAKITRAELVVVDDIGMLALRTGRRRGVLPAGRRHLRATLPGRHQQHPPLQSAHVRWNVCAVAPKHHGFEVLRGSRASST